MTIIETEGLSKRYTALRGRGRSPSTSSRCRWKPGRCTASSGRTGAARRRRSGCSSGSSTRAGALPPLRRFVTGGASHRPPADRRHARVPQLLPLPELPGQPAHRGPGEGERRGGDRRGARHRGSGLASEDEVQGVLAGYEAAARARGHDDRRPGTHHPRRAGQRAGSGGAAGDPRHHPRTGQPREDDLPLEPHAARGRAHLHARRDHRDRPARARGERGRTHLRPHGGRGGRRRRDGDPSAGRVGVRGRGHTRVDGTGSWCSSRTAVFRN